MTHTYTNSAGRTYLFIDVPKEGEDFRISSLGLLWDMPDNITLHKLPPNATYRFIALRSDITEEQCREIVGGGPLYPHFEMDGYRTHDAKYSFSTLFATLHIQPTQEKAIVQELNEIV